MNKVPDVIRRAADEVARLCAGRGRVTRSGLVGRNWTMCIPRRPDDSDEVFSDLIEAAATMERDYIAACSERDALAMHPPLEAEYSEPLPDDQVVSDHADRAFRFAIQDADRRFQVDGAGGSKTWFRDYLVPELGKRGLRVIAALPSSDGAA